MATPVSTEIGMSLEDFIRAYDQEGPFELIDGERINLVPTVSEHSELIKWLYDLLRDRERADGQVRVYFETPYVLVYSSSWVKGARVPDIMVYRADRLAAYKQQDSEWNKKPFVLVPDLCIEVVSQNDIYTEVDEKVSRYLADGVLLVWVLNPRTESVYTHQQGSVGKLTDADMLEGGSIVPGFKVAVKDIFAIF